MLGGLRIASERLSWPARDDGRSKIVMHCADAPAHGRRFHTEMSDDWPDGHPSDPTLDKLFGTYKTLGIEYLFLRLNKYCDKMLDAFAPALGHAVDVYNLSEGFSPAALTAAVATGVTGTVLKKTATVSLGAGVERARPYKLDTEAPAFGSILPVKVTLTEMELPSVEDIVSGAHLPLKASRVWAKVAPHPFAMGAVRLAYHALLLYPPEVSTALTTGSVGPTADWILDEHVFKERINMPAKSALDELRYLTDLETQTVASALAFEFNGVLKGTRAARFKVKYLEVNLVMFPGEDRRVGASDVGRFEKGGKILPRWMSIEKKFRDLVSMVKFTNNGKFVKKAPTPEEIAADPSLADMAHKIEVAVAYSHFTHHVTGGYLMVTDLQGINTVDPKAARTLLLTDPAIHCKDPVRFGATNFGEAGMALFFERHECNSVCAAAGLPPCARSRAK